jgi:hypothetical protein
LNLSQIERVLGQAFALLMVNGVPWLHKHGSNFSPHAFVSEFH